MRRTFVPRPRLVLFVVLVMLAGSSLPALAHAEFLRSNPEANAVLDTAPAFIEIEFTERLEQTYSQIKVYDAAGIAVDGGDSRVDPTNPIRLTVSLRSLPQGVYTVVWRVLSAIDGHVTSGAFAFAVGQQAAPSIPVLTPGSMSLPAHAHTGTFFRWMVFLSLAVLFGGNVFVLAVWEPARRRAGGASAAPGLSPPWREWTAYALVVFFAGSLLMLLGQAGGITDADLVLPWNPAVSQVLFTTRYGAIWLVRIVLGLALVAVAFGRNLRPYLPSAGLAGLMLITVSLLSHAASDIPPTLPVLVDTLHFLAASVWVGGLLFFAGGLSNARSLPTPRKTSFTADLIPRFSSLAITSVATLAVTGLFASLSRVGSWEALFGTLYGRTLIFKLAIAVPMLAFGANNLLRVTPRMQRAAATRAGDASLVERFRGYVTTESYLGMALFLSVALLTAVPPAHTPPRPTGITTVTRADDLAMALEISPGRVGVNAFSLRLTSGGRPLEHVREVSLRFDPSDGHLPTSELVLEEKGNGEYTAQGANLSLPTNWRVRAAIRRQDRFDTFGDMRLDLSPASARTPWSLAAGVTLLVGAFAYVSAQRRLAPTRTAFVGFGIVPAIALAVAGISVASRLPPTTPADQINPIPPTAESISKGTGLYQANCLPCHGESGKGDGPVGLTLRPPPADLVQHAVPGVHTDGQLFEWISHGYPGSVMPGFEGRLTDEERWHIVNFLRTLAPP